jgi:hypothetical protein
MLVVISDTGYVCDAKVVDGINEQIDKEAQETIKKGHYGVSRRNGPPKPQVVLVRNAYWVDSKGKFTPDKSHTTSNVRSETRPPQSGH